MEYRYRDQRTGGELVMLTEEASLDKMFYSRQQGHNYYTIAWNTGPDQWVVIDGVNVLFASGALLPLMMNQSYHLDMAEHCIMFRFNREFYCVVDHDAEVSCVGFIFYGPVPVMQIHLDEQEKEKMYRLCDMFIEEFEGEDDVKLDMLRMLLVRLIIKLTRLAKKQFVNGNLSPSSYDVLRQYCLLVERFYRKEKQVSYYAAQLHKSPKTLAHTFSKLGQKAPLRVIRDRVMLEVRRLMLYTDKSVKEIGYELGFEDPAHFGKFVKQESGLTPGELKKSLLNG
jgi:AraC-like DNA-binding protein